MSYLEKYDNFVMKKCVESQVIRTIALRNLANGRLTISHFGGYIAQKPISKNDLILGLSKRGIDPKEVMKGLDMDVLLLEINKAGVQIEQIFCDDLEQLWADLPSDDEES